MAENRCVCCGEIVPEGRQVCPTCEARASVPKYDPDEFFNRKKQTVVKFKCAVCGHLTPIPTRDMPPLLWRDDLITSSEFLTHSGPNGFEIHFRTPDREKYLEVEKACRKVIGHGKRQTNADRIRQMTDEELAQIITDDWCELLNCASPCDGHCDLKVLGWLQQEVDT